MNDPKKYIQKDTDIQIANKEFIKIIESINLDDLKNAKADIVEQYLNKIKDIKSNTDKESNQKAIEKSLFANILSKEPKDTYIYKTSKTFDFLKEYNLIRNGFYITAGFSSSGKTSFSIQLALDLLEHNENTVLIIYSMDDSIPFITSKITKQLLDKTKHSENISKIKSSFRKDIHKYSEHIKDSIKNRLHIFENLNIFENYNTKTINDHIETIKNQSKYSNIKDLQIIVVIDYLQVIDAFGNNDVRTALNNACKELNKIQKKHDCMMLALSQLSNEGNYRETSEIRNIADVIIKQYKKPEYLEKIEKQTNVDKNKECMNFIFSIEKDKDGESGMMYEAKINSNFCFYNFGKYIPKPLKKAPSGKGAKNSGYCQDQQPPTIDL